MKYAIFQLFKLEFEFLAEKKQSNLPKAFIIQQVIRPSLNLCYFFKQLFRSNFLI